MNKEEYDRKREQFIEWAASNDHNIMTSFPKSGRNYLAGLIRKASGRIVVAGVNPDVDPSNPGLCFSDVFLYVVHLGIWQVRGDKGRYILLIRDPRDAILSRTYQEAVETVRDPGEVLKSNRWVVNNIRTWVDYFTLFMQYSPHIVQYERLCMSPIETLESIFGFLGLEPVEKVEDVIPMYDMVKPDPMELRKFVRKKFTTGRDRYEVHCLKWQKDSLIDQDFLDNIWREAGDLMESYGYTKQGHSNILWKQN